jgi:hydrogenase/urease accessory protein HupE
MKPWIMRTLRCALLALGLLPPAALAHEMTIAEMSLRELSPGDFIWQWTATSDRLAYAEDLYPQWPPACRVDGNLLHCGPQGLKGEFSVDGVGRSYSAAMIKVYWLDGATRVYTLTGAQPSIQLFGSAEDQRGWSEIAYAYLVLGVEHILSGVDHLLFVIGLLFLVGFRKRLIGTITAFTLAHSLTLASSALGWLTLRSPPVEATIALSIMLVAGEALHTRQTAARRWPALVAFGFGLVHGLGFAGALKDIGLPQNHLLIALLTFNLGVEIGQLITVLACWLLVRLLARFEWFRAGRVPALYVIGGVAAYWSWLRIVAIVS